MTIEELLSDKTRWTQHVFARNQQGQTCRAEHPQAVCWCLEGAAMKVYPHEKREAIFNQLRLAARNLYQEGLLHVNDVLGHTAVLKVVKTAAV